MIYIGIDTGVHTGYAEWDSVNKRFNTIETIGICTAFDYVLKLRDIYSTSSICVRFEDARQRKWFGNADREQLQGAGSIKRDCSIWEEFLTGKSIPFNAIPPQRNITKLSKESFSKITGYNGRTSEHARDAAMLVFNL